jgi:hypothetical protein
MRLSIACETPFCLETGAASNPFLLRIVGRESLDRELKGITKAKADAKYTGCPQAAGKIILTRFPATQPAHGCALSTGAH